MYNYSCGWCAKDWFSILRELWPAWDIKRDILEDFNTCTKIWRVWRGSGRSGGHSTEGKSGPLQNKSGEEANHAWRKANMWSLAGKDEPTRQKQVASSQEKTTGNTESTQVNGRECFNKTNGLQRSKATARGSEIQSKKYIYSKNTAPNWFG